MYNITLDYYVLLLCGTKAPMFKVATIKVLHMYILYLFVHTYYC